MAHTLLASATRWVRTADGRIITGLLAAIAVWRVALEVINQLVPRFASIDQRHPEYLSAVAPIVTDTNYGLGRWASWDGFHYLGIVLNGYQYGRQEYGIPLETAFFPAYSFLVRLISFDGAINPLVVGLLLNIILTAVAVIGIYFLTCRMVELYAKLSRPQARKAGLIAALLFLITPSSFFMGAFYADALLVAAGTWALVCALHDRYFVAALCAGIATGSKSAGLIIALAIVLIYLERHNYSIWRFWTWMKARVLLRLSAIGLIAISGLLAYMGFCYVRFGDPLLFMKAQELWHRYNSLWFLRKLWGDYYQHLFQPLYYGGTYGYIYMLMVQALPFITIGIAWWFGRKYKTYWPLYMTIVLLILALASGIMQSLNRYCLLLVPLYAVAALILVARRTNPYVVGALVLLSIQLLVVFTAGFVQGAHFAG